MLDWRSCARCFYRGYSCDREIIAWAASTKDFSGETIRDMLLIAVENRFGAYRAPHLVECLSDNGSCYIAAENN